MALQPNVIRIITDFNMETGEYTLEFKSLGPNKFVDYVALAPLLKKIFADADRRITGGQPPEPDLKKIPGLS